MKKNIPFIKPDFNPKNKTHRKNLYEEVFINKHNTESLIFTLQKETINLTGISAIAALDPTPENLLSLAEAIGDLNIAIEFTELAIPKLHEVAVGSKYRKLKTLRANTDKSKQEEDTPVNGSSVEIDEVPTSKYQESIKDFSDSIPDKKGVVNFLKYLLNYFK